MTAPGRPSPAEELAALHKAMDPWAQAKLLRMARSMARGWPAKRGGHLRLVLPRPEMTPAGEATAASAIP